MRMSYNLRMRLLQLPTTYYLLPTQRTGQAVLSLIFLMGGIMVMVGLTLAFIATSFVNSAYGFQASQRAQAVASSGIYDALMRLARDKDFSDADYSVPLGDDSASVTVTQDSPVVGQATIVSIATVSRRKRQVRAVVSRNASTSRIVVVSWD